MLTELCGVLRNWFETDRISGTYTVENGSITLPFLQNGQFFRVVGSVFNDGVHQYPASDLTDELFHGAAWAMAIDALKKTLLKQPVKVIAKELSKIIPFFGSVFAATVSVGLVEAAGWTLAGDGWTLAGDFERAAQKRLAA